MAARCCWISARPVRRSAWPRKHWPAWCHPVMHLMSNIIPGVISKGRGRISMDSVQLSIAQSQVLCPWTRWIAAVRFLKVNRIFSYRHRKSGKVDIQKDFYLRLIALSSLRKETDHKRSMHGRRSLICQKTRSNKLTLWNEWQPNRVLKY